MITIFTPPKMADNTTPLAKKARFSFRLKLSDIGPGGWSIVALNAAILAGMFIFGWEPLYIVALYMAESFIVGIFNAVKLSISLAQHIPSVTIDEKQGNVRGWGILPFFLLHYNLFVGVQFGIFWAFVNFGHNAPFTQGINTLFGGSALLGLLGIFITHLFLFLKDYMASGPYRQLAPDTLMMQPYGRILVQQFVVILGGFLGGIFGFVAIVQDGEPVNAAATGYAILLIVLKTYVDLLAHTKTAQFKGGLLEAMHRQQNAR